MRVRQVFVQGTRHRGLAMVHKAGCVVVAGFGSELLGVRPWPTQGWLSTNRVFVASASFLFEKRITLFCMRGF